MFVQHSVMNYGKRPTFLKSVEYTMGTQCEMDDHMLPLRLRMHSKYIIFPWPIIFLCISDREVSCTFSASAHASTTNFFILSPEHPGVRGGRGDGHVHVLPDLCRGVRQDQNCRPEGKANASHLFLF